MSIVVRTGHSLPMSLLLVMNIVLETVLTGHVVWRPGSYDAFLAVAQQRVAPKLALIGPRYGLAVRE